jgi:hypothetical protein
MGCPFFTSLIIIKGCFHKDCCFLNKFNCFYLCLGFGGILGFWASMRLIRSRFSSHLEFWASMRLIRSRFSSRLEFWALIGLIRSRFSSRLEFWASISEIAAKWEHISSRSNKIYEKSLIKRRLL